MVKAMTVCPKCVTNKAGKRTCCARGGSWFSRCGDPENPDFEYSWSDGVAACQGKLLSGCVLSVRFNIVMRGIDL